MSKSKKSRLPAKRRALRLESLEQRVVFAADLVLAVNDLFQVETDHGIKSEAPGVFANDHVPEGSTLTGQLFSGPAHGTLNLAADGSFEYEPETGYIGLDSFVYLATDGVSSGMAAVTLDVAPVETPPVSQNDAYAVNEDESLSITPELGILANDSDAGGDSLAASLVSGPLNGSVSLAEDGSFTYTPNAGYHGIDGFSYIVSDGELQSSVATVMISVNSVNDVPVANNDEFTTDEDAPLVIDPAGVLANDTDADGDTLTATLEVAPSNGTVTLNPDGSFTYTPNADFHGVDGFSYVVSDGTAESDVAAVTINVSPLADAPVANNDEFTTDEDTALVIDPAGVLANDTDGDGDAITAALEVGPSHGTVTLNPDGSFTYTPNADFNGVDGFSYVVSDGTLESDVAAVTINVNALNDAPLASADEFTMDEDTTLNIEAAGVLANDSDADGDALSATLVEGPANGSVTLNSDGSFSYTPNANFNGIDSFTYTAGDGSAESEAATVTINVSAANDAPIASGDEFTMDEDAQLVIESPGILANDTDADGDALSATLVEGPANGTVTLNSDGSFSYAPNANFNGSDSFTYTAGDGSAESGVATVTINVSSVNDAPISSGDEFTMDEDAQLVIDAPGILANDTDVDGDGLSATLIDGPANGTVSLNADGSFTYTPNADFHGVDGFSYLVNDGSLDSEAATVTINVTSVNDTPTANGDEFTMDEDTQLVIAAPGILANDADADGDAISATLVTGPANGTVTLNSDGSFTYTPNSDFAGVDSFTYTAGDGSAASEAATVKILVNDLAEPPAEINVRPQVANDRYEVVAGTTLQIEASGVLANDSDSNGSALTATLFRGPQNGTLALAANGSFSYTPNAGFTGRDSFLYRASDGELHSIIAAATIYVLPAPPPANSVAPGEMVCEVTPPVCDDPPPAVEQDKCEKGRHWQRVATIRERVIDSLIAARATRNSSARCVDALMSRGCWWK